MSLLETYGNLVSLTGHRARQHTLSPVRQQDVDPLPSSVALLTISKEADAACAMITLMISPEAAPLLRTTHVEPTKP